MRSALLLALCILATVLPASAQRDRIETPWKIKIEGAARKDGAIISVAFKSGANVRFHTTGDKVTALNFQSGKVKYTVPAKVCSRLRKVLFKSTTISWTGKAASPAQSKYVYLEFRMGSGKDQRFGELPRVHLTFENGKFQSASVSRKIRPNVWDSFDL